MRAILGESRATTWLAAIQFLSGNECPDWESYNLVLEIEKPMLRTAEDQRIETLVDNFLRNAGRYPLSTVAETIFPAGEYRRSGASGVYETYPNEIYPAVKRLPELHWGTYAYRLVRHQAPNGMQINPLKCCVEKIKRQLAGRTVKKACYELSLSDLGVDLALYDPVKDRNRHRGGPCLSHISLKVTRNRTLILTALYRSHFYVERALGNLLGLARLQAFVCEQTGLSPSSLVCVSTYATLDRNPAWSKKQLRGLIQDLAQHPHRESDGAHTSTVAELRGVQ